MRVRTITLKRQKGEWLVIDTLTIAGKEGYGQPDQAIAVRKRELYNILCPGIVLSISQQIGALIGDKNKTGGT